MKEINMKHDRKMLVDDEDYPLLNRFNWWAFKSRYTYYAQARIGGKMVLVHRLIMPARKNQIIDHKDNNGLNNQKNNLRVCSFSQNNQNSKNREHNTSGFRGVHYNRRDKMYYCRIGNKGKRLFVGCFKDSTEAAKAYDVKAKELHGQFCKLNFPEGRE